jgi:hypothetical protein
MPKIFNVEMTGFDWASDGDYVEYRFAIEYLEGRLKWEIRKRY